MAILKTASGFVPLVENLAGYWETKYEDLPGGLRILIDEHFMMSPWDAMSVEEKRSDALYHDVTENPSYEPSLYQGLLELVDELTIRIEDARSKDKDSTALALKDVSERIENMIKADRDTIGADLKELRTKCAEYEAVANHEFNPDSSTYPYELDIAMQAWRGALNDNTSDVGAKKKIMAWLDNHYSKELSNEAKSRISVVANWEKSGGRRPNDIK